MLHIDLKVKELDYHIDEAIKTIRTNISFCGDDIKSIVVTSCIPGEGKSTVSFELARSLADSGKKVIFLDSDLRKSALIGRFKVAKGLRGFTHFLSGQNQIGEVLFETNIKNLHVIFAGPVPPNPAELLGNNRFQILLNALREKYDYIIIDTAPLGSVIDSAIVAKVCDGAMLVTESNKISYKFAQKIKKQLEKSDCKILGVALNKVKQEKSSYYNKYYGKYGTYK